VLKTVHNDVIYCCSQAGAIKVGSGALEQASQKR